MGCCVYTEDSPKQSVPAKEEKLIFEANTSILELPFNISTPPPPLVNANQVIFLSTNSKTKTTEYITLDLNKRVITTNNPIKIKCNKQFDIINTVYTLNTTQNKIYFIENNKDIKTLDLSQNEIISLHKSVETTNGNFINIYYSEIYDKVYIFGAESKSDLDKHYINIPYSIATKHKGNNEYVARIRNFGQYTRVINTNIDGSYWIFFICGGQKNYGNVKYPTDVIWKYNIANDTVYNDQKIDVTKQKWQNHYLFSAAHSCGIVNYEDKFIFCFGGQVLKRKHIQKTNCIYILPLKNGEYNLRKGWWYELERRLPIKECFHAIYSKESKVIHLFSYNGKYYILPVKDILDGLGMDNGAQIKAAWIEQKGPVLPTKAISIRNLGPKYDGESDSDE